MSKIFESFTQADASTTRKFGGTGLGLTISKNIVNLMGGDITVDSKLNKGSSFKFTATFKISKKTCSFLKNSVSLCTFMYGRVSHTRALAEETNKQFINNFIINP